MSNCFSTIYDLSHKLGITVLFVGFNFDSVLFPWSICFWLYFKLIRCSLIWIEKGTHVIVARSFIFVSYPRNNSVLALILEFLSSAPPHPYFSWTGTLGWWVYSTLCRTSADSDQA